MRIMVFLFMLLSSGAFAQSSQYAVVLGSQFGGPIGFSSGDGLVQCTNLTSLKYEQCKQIAKPEYAVGTVTVKTSAELLVALRCGGTTVYQMERFQGTSDFVTPKFPKGIKGPCWVYYEVLNNSGQALPDGPTQGGLFEYQIVVYNRDAE